MATITLRPSADVSIGHNKYQNGSSASVAAYTLIDDVVSDEDATTIGQKHHSTTVTSKESTFRLGGDDYNHKIFINSITIYYDYYCNNPAKNGNMNSIAISTALIINDSTSEYLKNSISNVSTESDSGGYNVLNSVFTPSNYSALTLPYDSISDLNLQFKIKTEWKCGSSTVTNDQSMYISQVYVVIDYTDAYTFTAVGNETTDVISPGIVKDGTTVYFEAAPKLNHRFLGWYSNSTHQTLVTENQTYSVQVSGADLTLYANSKRIEAINVYHKSNGTWKLVKNLYIKENGTYRQISAQDFGNELYFSEKSYLNLVH